MRFYILCLIICFCFNLSGQKALPDSVHLNVIRQSDNDSLVGRAYIELAKLIYRKDPDLCEAYIDSAKMYSEFTKHPESQASIKFTMGKLLKMKKDDLAALDLLREALSDFQSLSNQYMIEQTHFQIGSVHINLGELQDANESFIKSFKIAELRQDTSEIANCLNALGVVNRKIGNLNKASEYYSQALDIFKKIDNKNGVSSCLLNLAIIEKQEERYDKSLTLYQEAIRVGESSDKRDEGMFAYIYGNMSAMYHTQDKIKLAIEYGEKALAIREKSASQLELSNSYVGLAANYQEIGKFDKAENYLKKAQQTSNNSHEILYIINKTYSDIEWQRKNYKQAYLYLNESKDLRDSIYNLEKTKQMDRLNTEFETERKEVEISKLELEDKLKESQIKQQRILLGGSAFGITALSFLLFRLFGKNKKIKEQNSVISESLDEKELLLKEIHHRVKNNLQVISSLLGIQSRGIKDQVAKDAIKESRARVHSMSLIHQDLYKKDNLLGINVRTYLNKLCQDLFKTYDISGGRISLQTNIDDIQLDVDSVIPIGLIVNELMTNSLKYAFPDSRTGEILISLHLKENNLQLIVSDDGVGLDEEHLKSKTDSFGHKLIRAFKQKLDAEVSILSDHGTKIIIDIQQFKINH